MADTPTTHYGFLLQQPGTNPGTWGGKLNGNWGSIDGLLYTASSSAASALALATDAMPMAGGTFSGDVRITAPPSANNSVGFRGCPIRTISDADTLVAADAGGTCRRNSASTGTLTIPPMGTAGWILGTTIVIRNAGAGVLIMARGSGVSLVQSGSTNNKNWGIPARGTATILLEATNEWVIIGADLL